MMNCDSDIRDYHRKRVALAPSDRKKLMDRRNRNRERLQRGLEKHGRPKPKRSITQGSFKMRTAISQPGNTYDIDDGVVFTEESLRGPMGADKSPLDARKMVRDAVHSNFFKTPPAVKTNCVRVYYDDGPYVDIPVYRMPKDLAGNCVFELASARWKRSDPDGVNAWFHNWILENRATGKPHSRKLIRLLKSICKNRSRSLPSGFVITVLVEQCYTFPDARLDIALFRTIDAIRERLRRDPLVKHPVVAGDWLIDFDTVNKTRNFREVLDCASMALATLSRPNCTRSMALKRWRRALNTDFFDDQIAKAGDMEKAESLATAATLATSPKPYAPVERTHDR